MVRRIALACAVALAASPAKGFVGPAVRPLSAQSPAAAAHARGIRMGAGEGVSGGNLDLSSVSAFDPLTPVVEDHMGILEEVAPQMAEGLGMGMGVGMGMGMGEGMQMSAGGAAADRSYGGARIGPPPDLPSLLLHNRIVYLGMPLVPAVTELIIAELLYLNYESSAKPIYMYINTPGTSTPDGRSIGFETEAFAISDCMNYVKPPVYTIAVGQAFGMGAMLLASGHKGGRACLPNASIMLHQPRSMARGQASDIAIKAKEVLANRKTTVQMLAQACGKPYEQVEQDAGRTFYMSPDEAVEYGIIDKVLRTGKKETKVQPKFLDALSIGTLKQ